MALFCATIKRDSVSLLRFQLLSHVRVFSCEMSLVSRLKPPLSFFFYAFLFSSHFLSIDPRFVSIVSGGCNKSFSALVYVVFESLHRGVNAVFNASKFSSSFFSSSSSFDFFSFLFFFFRLLYLPAFHPFPRFLLTISACNFSFRFFFFYFF